MDGKGTSPWVSDDWLQAKQANYCAVEVLLQAVKKDVDALAEKIDRAQPSPPMQTPVVGDSSPLCSVSPSVRNTSRYPKLDPGNTQFATSLEDGDEYMDICIRCKKNGQEEETSPAIDIYQVDNQYEHLHQKTWSSPSDFNFHNPFDEDAAPHHLHKCLPEEHAHLPIKETDLDDLTSDRSNRDNDSAESLSPSVSPTFDYFISDDVCITNMVISSNDVVPANTSVLAEDFQLHDTVYNLTTIDEASEECEDEWSSSELDSSTRSDQLGKCESLGHAATSQQTHDQTENLIDENLKTQGHPPVYPVVDDSACFLSTSHASQSVDSSGEDRLKGGVVSETAAPATSSTMSLHKPGSNEVVMRAKQPASSSASPVKQRPVSAGFTVVTSMKAGSQSSSVQSIALALSQESFVISEADSFVTVASGRTTTMGSDDVYITACSDSDVSCNQRLENEECLTLPRRKAKIPITQRHRWKEGSLGFNSSSDSDEDSTLLVAPEAVVVTPKFSRLPSKLSTYSSDKYETEQTPDVDGTPTDDGQAACHAHQHRTPLQRPHCRSSIQPVLDDPSSSAARDDDQSPTHPSDSSSSSSSDSEAQYDASVPMRWTYFDQPGPAVMPSLSYPPRPQAEEAVEPVKKRLSCIEESNASTDSSVAGANTICSESEDPGYELPADFRARGDNSNSLHDNEPASLGHSSVDGGNQDATEREAVVVVPKFFFPTYPESFTQTGSGEAVDRLPPPQPAYARPPQFSSQSEAVSSSGQSGLANSHGPIGSHMDPTSQSVVSVDPVKANTTDESGLVCQNRRQVSPPVGTAKISHSNQLRRVSDSTKSTGNSTDRQLTERTSLNRPSLSPPTAAICTDIKSATATTVNPPTHVEEETDKGSTMKAQKPVFPDYGIYQPVDISRTGIVCADNGNRTPNGARLSDYPGYPPRDETRVYLSAVEQRSPQDSLNARGSASLSVNQTSSTPQTGNSSQLTQRQISWDTQKPTVYSPNTTSTRPSEWYPAGESIFGLAREDKLPPANAEAPRTALTVSTIRELPVVQSTPRSEETVRSTLEEIGRPQLTWTARYELYDQFSRLPNELPSNEQHTGYSRQTGSHFKSASGHDDIQEASQRTSLIMQGSTAYMEGKPNAGGTSRPSPKSFTPPQQENKARSSYLQAATDTPTTPTGQGSVQLMQAPMHCSLAGPIQPIKFPGEKRASSPSPPRDSSRRSPISSTAVRAHSASTARPKWHLKPIPTDGEIRERLRSRSRQRAEERQSRSMQPGGQLRVARSESRFRCTDLDSAIAESKGDVQEGTAAAPASALSKENYSYQHHQSGSLFDLDKHEPKGGLDQSQAKVKMLSDTKSYNSLLETDIDTGENYERPIVLETDVDKMDTHINNGHLPQSTGSKTRSLFNLSSLTPGTNRREIAQDIDFGPPSNVWPSKLESSVDNSANDWQRTKSLQGPLHSVHHDRNAAADHSSVFGLATGQVKPGVKSLIERMKERATSSYELRLAQSLTKLGVPEWLDRADCLTSSVTESSPISDCPQSERLIRSRTSQSTRTQPEQLRGMNSSSIRSLTSVRRSEDAYPLRYSFKSSRATAVETVAEPTWPKPPAAPGSRFIRPSQELRERGESLSRLRPIQSKLKNSMLSTAGNTASGQDKLIGIQVAPRARHTARVERMLKLGPEDFVPKTGDLYDPVGLRKLTRANTEPINGLQNAQQHRNEPVSTVDEVVVMQASQTRYLPKDYAATNTVLYEANGRLTDIKCADQDSGTEHSSEGAETNRGVLPCKSTASAYPQSSVYKQTVTPNMGQPHSAREQVWDNGKTGGGAVRSPRSPDTYGFNSDDPVEEEAHGAADWRSIDAEGETESEVTDGMDQISDLTCLTSLIDTCATRHHSLLANRPSALEHLLTGLGWWPPAPEAEHRYLPPTATEAISTAAHEFDVEEDSHRFEFLKLLASPESRRPVNLSEFALSQLSAGVHRRPEDGLLYVTCGLESCHRPPVQVGQAHEWRACANCYTLYCSNACRSNDRKTMQHHPSVCSFARAKRVCNRIVRNLAHGQLTGLTALAKTGMARLGRGGILLPFALVRHAEIFLQRAQMHALTNTVVEDNSIRRAASCWEKHHQPSPGGLMSPPLYLTLNELNELDSALGAPCCTYNPSTSMVLIIVVCAYDLIARSDGRPVHLFNQSVIHPFPVQPAAVAAAVSGRKLNGVEHKLCTAIRPALPQTNGVLAKPDRQAIASREAYMIRLQRMLRERGVSLRHHHPNAYAQIAQFVETGVPFSPVHLVFHDFVLREEVVCTICPLTDPQIHPIRNFNAQWRQVHLQMSDAHQIQYVQGGEEPRRAQTRGRTSEPADAVSMQQQQEQRFLETMF